MGTLDADGFPGFLSSRLSQGTRLGVYHVSTPASTCPPLFTPPPQRSGADTTLESHFLAISKARRETDTVGHTSDVLVLGIEVLIFTSTDLTTIFVSKADSTGLLNKPTTAGSPRSSLAQTVITAFLQFLLRSQHHRHRHRLVLSLFARSQNQYLFPGSIENATKHVLDDRQLIKWWCRVLDPLARQKNSHGLPSVKAHLVVPGCDGGETKAFFPPSARLDPTSDPRWVNAYPVNLLVEDMSLPPRCLVPRLPDDPKSRFLEDLDAQCDENGSWRGIKTLDQFWEMMSYRQECSAGRLVGFIWVVFTSDTEPPAANGVINDDLSMERRESIELQRERKRQALSKPEAMTSPAPKSRSNALLSSAGMSTSSTIEAGVRKIPSVMAAIRTTTAGGTTEQVINETVIDSSHTQPQHVTTDAAFDEAIDDTEKSATIPSAPARAHVPPAKIVLPAEDYQTLMDELLRLDFAGEELANESSKRWCGSAAKLAGVSAFGITVDGESTVPEQPTTSNVDVKPAVNMITGVRKKRKPCPDDATTSGGVSEQPVIYNLASNLIRKKVKH